MVNGITALASPLASLALRRNLDHARAVCAIVGQALLKGYAWANVVDLVRQFNLETGFGTSRAFVKDKNPFGMGRVYTRPTTQTGWRESEAGGAYEGENLGRYKTIEDGVKDRFMWDKHFGVTGTAPGYADAVRNTDAGSVGIVAALLLLIIPAGAILLAKILDQ